MKPLLAKDLAAFMQRFDNFKDGELRSIEVVSPLVMRVTLAGQDTARAFDWVSLTFEFSNISDARLLQEEQLRLVDMNEGISLIHEENRFAFAIGESLNINNTKNATIYILSESLKYQEGSF